MKYATIMTLCLIPLLTACSPTPISSLIGYSDDWQSLPQQTGPGLVADPTSPIPDVMMPIGFKAIPNKCTSKSDSVYRTANHTYQGRAKLTDLIRYFQAHLPDADWKMVNRLDDPIRKTLILNWQKGLEDLQITLSKRASVSTVVVIIQPRSSGSLMIQTPQPALPQAIQPAE